MHGTFFRGVFEVVIENIFHTSARRKVPFPVVVHDFEGLSKMFDEPYQGSVNSQIESIVSGANTLGQQRAFCFLSSSSGSWLLKAAQAQRREKWPGH